MKKNTGLIAALTVILAIFGISNLPKSSPGGGQGATEAKKAKAAETPPENKKTELAVACKEIRNRLLSFAAGRDQAHKLDRPQKPDPDKWQLPDSCYASGKAPAGVMPSLKSSLHFVVATAPNPISTHLPLIFDRLVEVMQQAAADENYTYDSSWFPWNEVTKDYPLFGDQRVAEQAQDIQQGQPGVLVFRRSVVSPDEDESPFDGGLIVFLVAEQPTGGIDREEFENSLAWMDRLGVLTPERGLKILGPTFSGSLPSLDQALDSEKLRPAGPAIGVTVSSGSVNSELSYSWFEKRVKKHAGTFRTALEGDPLMTDRLFEYLNNQGYSRGCVAIISEDETAFGAPGGTKTASNAKDGVPAPKGKTGEAISDCETGQSVFKNESGKSVSDCQSGKSVSTGEPCGDESTPIFLYYPRDIAMLRSAYEQQSIFNTGKQQANNNATSTTLRGDLSEPASSSHDSARSYGGQLTPLAQESVLLGISTILKQRRAQFALLRSTNPLDQIFLAQFLRRANPAVRLVIDGSDLLFQRGAEGTSLRGVMVLSTYPLFTWESQWTSSLRAKKNGSDRIFSEDVAEGLYIAARELFRDTTRENESNQVPITNYTIPAWERGAVAKADEQRPPTWISVIGHRQFWPVGALSGQPVGSHGKSLLPAASERGERVVDDGDSNPLRIPAELVIVLIACSVWSLLHLVWCWRGSITPFPSLFRMAQFAPPPGNKQHPALIAFGCLLPAMVAVVTGAISGVWDGSLRDMRGSVVTIWALAIVMSSLLACWGNFRIASVCGQPAPRWQLTVAACAVAAFAAFVWLYFILSHRLNESNRIPTHWRGVHLLSGVSGLLPQLLWIVGLYFWFWFSLRGLAMFGDDRPQLPSKDDLPRLADDNSTSAMPMFSDEDVAIPVEEDATPVGKHYLQRMLPATLFGTICISALVLEDDMLRTLGERRFGVMMFYWMCICIAIVLADTLQLWITWRRLRPLLVYLDRLPLRRTLASLRGLSWGSVWAMSGNTLEERYRLISREVESLRHLRNRLNGQNYPAISARIKECLDDEIPKLSKWYVKLKDQVVDAGQLKTFQGKLAQTAGTVLQELLLPSWRSETESLIFNRTSPGPKEDADEYSAAAVKGSVGEHVAAAEEYFVLPYLGFIQNVLGRMRTMVLGSLCLFVATTLAVSSYPFDPQPVLGGILLTVFSITGGTVMLVFAQMHRDATLSHITNTRPGELGGEFWVHLVTFGVGPLLGLLTALFPSVTDFVSSWLQPGVQALK